MTASSSPGFDRVEIVHSNFVRRVTAGDLPERHSQLSPADASLEAGDLVEMFRAQVLSRHLDRMARSLQARGEGFYTIGSSGHEGSAAIATALRPTDMAFLHYRDAAFQIARAGQVPGQQPLWDMLLSFTTSAEDPISGGRHKVLGSVELAIPPQTSTIASHLPKAVGAAYSIGLGKKIGLPHRRLADDGLVMCSFGDASLNHASAQAAINTAGWTAYQGVPLPIVFVCEDNGIGISVRTPANWVASSMSGRAGVEYYRCSGLDMIDTYAVATAAAAEARENRRPVFLHMSCVRLYGHAGADVATSYLPMAQIEADEGNDPLLHGARILIEHAGVTAGDVVDLYHSIDEEVRRCAEEVVTRPRLRTPAAVMSSIVPPPRSVPPSNPPSAPDRERIFGAHEIAAMGHPQHMAKLLNWALTDLMAEHPEVIVAGEDVGVKGGVYGVTQKLVKRFGPNRVIDTILDEQSILGLAIGLAHNGFVPIPEIQFLAYLHNAEDQLRGEAATLPFFSNGQFTNPMVVRIAGLGYQRGFGGHFHNDNSLAVLRDIPGIVIACPSDGADAVHLLRDCVRLAREEQRVCVFIEPIARYMTRDLYDEGDGFWARVYPMPSSQSDGRSVRLLGGGTDLAFVTYGNGVHLSAQAQRVLEQRHGIRSRVIDMRWLAPLPADEIIQAAAPCERVLIVDECRETGSQSEALMALFAEQEIHAVSRLCARDSFIATGPSAAVTLPSCDSIIYAALASV